MQLVKLTQGSPEWHAHRRVHFNASDAPAMMGCSPYKTRAQLLHEMATGIAADIDAGTQRRFDDGHRFEALARPLAEEIIGEELYPVIGTEGRLSASFDGLTLLAEKAFEHKTLSAELADVLHADCKGFELPLHYQVQMEQQCLVSGADSVLFMATKWDGERLVDSRHCWYRHSDELAAKILAGWEQFAADLAAYVPPVIEAEVIGRTPETLPALRIEVTGMVTASNLDAFKQHALAVFSGINRNLKTDQDFADAEKTVKWCGDVEDRLAAAKQHALSQTESIDALFRAIDEIGAEARRVRLQLDKDVKARKEAIRGEIVADGVAGWNAHLQALHARLDGVKIAVAQPDFGGAIKGKKTVESLRNAVDTALAAAKIEASALADKIDANLRAYREQAAGFEFLFPDYRLLAIKAADDMAAVIKNRISEHEAAEAAKREAAAEREKQAQIAAQMRTLDAAEDAAIVAPPVAPARVIHPAAVALRGERPTLKLGEINARLGLTVSADFLTELGFEAHIERSSRLYRESEWPAICAGISAHVLAAAKAKHAGAA